jgi:predicted RNase H-like nuclease (RuvC/YqgF family)
MNYMVNISNIAKNRNMQRAIARGRKQILELQETVTTLEDNMDTLNAEVDVQRKTAERLKVSLDNTRNLLESSMSEYRKEMNRQAEVIRKQQLVVGDVYNTKLNQDFIVDSRYEWITASWSLFFFFH